MLNVQIIGDRELVARLAGMPANVRQALLKKCTALAFQLQRHIQSDKLSGQVLHVRTGALRASIFSSATASGTRVEGKASSSGDVKYAGIHEFGGTINIPEIVATNAKALAFEWHGRTVFFKKVAAHTVTMPERSFMRSSLADMKDQIIEEMTDAVRSAMRQR